MKKNLGIKVISEACGIVAHTIRTWESRYQIFTPERSPNGQRLYDENDLQKAKLVANLLDHGHGISKIARLSIAELEKLIALTPEVTTYSKTQVVNSNQVSMKLLFNYLKEFKIDKVASEIEHLRISVGAKEFIFGIVLPVMQSIGTMVAKGSYSVTQEHIISTIIRAQLGQISLPNLGKQNESIVLATPDGNMHELSILIADILCRANRTSTIYLGASHPAECLAQAMNALHSKVIVMGVVSSDAWSYEECIADYLLQVDRYLVHDISIILGGAYRVELPKYKRIKEVKFMGSFEEFDQSLQNFTLRS